MGDNFSYGSPTRRPRPSLPVDPVKLGIGVLAIGLVVGVAFAVFSVLRSGGDAAEESVRDAVSQVDVARDAEAQVVLTRAATTAQTLIAASAAGSADAAGVEALADAEPAFTYTTEASSGPEVVSVAAATDGWSAAVLSPSGSCLWIHLDASGAQTFGSGTPCTGEAAAAASDPAW